jgi:hypothetical protein
VTIWGPGRNGNGRRVFFGRPEGCNDRRELRGALRRVGSPGSWRELSPSKRPRNGCGKIGLQASLRQKWRPCSSPLKPAQARSGPLSPPLIEQITGIAWEEGIVPAGNAARSRWSSEATPPDSHPQKRRIPQGCQKRRDSTAAQTLRHPRGKDYPTPPSQARGRRHHSQEECPPPKHHSEQAARIFPRCPSCPALSPTRSTLPSRPSAPREAACC